MSRAKPPPNDPARPPDHPLSRVPLVRRPRMRPAEPVPAPGDAVPLTLLADAVLERQQADRLAAAEARSLSPPHIARVKAQLAAERAVEENLARGRAFTRAEIRKATDPARYGRDRASARFPAMGCVSFAPLRMLGATFAALIAPFVLYFGLVALLLL